MRQLKVGEHQRCDELVSGKFRIAVTTEVGPRVIGGWVGNSPNLFCVTPVKPIPGINTGFLLYGGHRLWHAPEVKPRTYAPDNVTVDVTAVAGGARRYTTYEPMNGLEKQLEIKPLGRERFTVTHRLVNRNQWAIELAPWALSVMAPGGVGVIPLQHNPKDNPYQADRQLNFWPYSNLDDPRLTVSEDYVIIRQDPKAKGPFKVGCKCPAGWIAYVNKGVALVKTMKYKAGATYPDYGCNMESYTCAAFLEIETLGPLAQLKPGQAAVHVETWQGLRGVGPVNTPERVRANLRRRVRA